MIIKLLSGICKKTSPPFNIHITEISQTLLFLAKKTGFQIGRNPKTTKISNYRRNLITTGPSSSDFTPLVGFQSYPNLIGRA